MSRVGLRGASSLVIHHVVAILRGCVHHKVDEARDRNVAIAVGNIVLSSLLVLQGNSWVSREPSWSQTAMRGGLTLSGCLLDSTSDDRKRLRYGGAPSMFDRLVVFLK